ncbi:hypothetical protein KUTeg_016695 [Tegillarca granosa]|uniref:PLAT domain-containing protein n=1 Tax=Tegillarca granosa TaxID=220873 RepID=A0ABQ9ERX1_TEGGR|nr:hypothetical protein KUTeg_016695 [Tegillarca granosa]
MQDVETSEEFVLNCDRWMARNKDDCDLTRELALSVKDKPPSPLYIYEVTIFTGDHWAAETDANLYITIFGTQGDTGKRMLYNSTMNQVKFRTGQIDVFEFEAVALGDLTNVEIGHNSKGHGAGIFIDNVVVVEKDSSKAFTQHVFPCRTWLDDREGDGKTWRNLPMLGDLTKIRLEHDNSNPSPAWHVSWIRMVDSSTGEEHIFCFNQWLAVDEGDGEIMREVPAKIKKQKPLPGVRPAVVPPSVITKWFKDIQPLKSQGKWSAWVFCGMENHGGTDEDVYLVICGMNGESKPVKINEKDQLNPSNVVKLDLSVGDIGAIIKIRLYFGEEYTGTPWYLQRVKLKDQDTGEEFNFECNKTLEGSDNNPNGKIELPAVRPDIEPLKDDEFTIYVATGNHDKSDTEAEIFCEIVGDWGTSGKILLTHSNNSVMYKKGQVDEFHVKGLELGEIHEITIGHNEKGRGQGWFCERVVVKSKLSPLMKVFPCNRWLDTGCEDRQLVRKLKPIGYLPELGKQLPSEGKSKGIWNCSVITADKDKLPSSAIDRSSRSRAISLVVYGDKGVTGPLELTNQNPELFLPGQIDVFSVSMNV